MPVVLHRQAALRDGAGAASTTATRSRSCGGQLRARSQRAGPARRRSGRALGPQVRHVGGRRPGPARPAHRAGRRPRASTTTSTGQPAATPSTPIASSTWPPSRGLRRRHEGAAAARPPGGGAAHRRPRHAGRPGRRGGPRPRRGRGDARPATTTPTRCAPTSCGPPRST